MSEDNRLSEYYKNKAMDINEAKRIVAEILNVLPDDISNIEVLKKGFTNTSFVFEYQNEKYINDAEWTRNRISSKLRQEKNS